MPHQRAKELARPYPSASIYRIWEPEKRILLFPFSMNKHASIRYITGSEIDSAKWDACVHTASNSLIYACSWWLDTMSANWDGLVLNDYEAVMPLTWNRKYGIKYLCQPPFTQQLGIFSRHAIPEILTQSFLNKASEHFNFAELCLNYLNPARGLDSRPNFILPLHHPYETLYANYKTGLKKSLQKASHTLLYYKKDFPLSAALDLN